MSKTIVHMGMHKTGSTSIQNSLFKNLDDPRFFYVSPDTSTSSLMVNVLVSEKGASHSLMRKRGFGTDEYQALRGKYLSSLRRTYEASGDKTAIISAESVTRLKESEYLALIGILAELSDEIEVVGYVRKPGSYMQSIFQQSVKTGHAFFDLKKYFPRYKKNFEKLYGPSSPRANLWLFDPATFENGCVVQDFCKRIGVDFRPAKVVRANESISLEALCLLYMYFKFGPGFGVGQKAINENNVLIRKLGKYEGARVSFDPALIQPVLDAHRDDILWMEERLGCELSEDIGSKSGKRISSEDDLLRIDRDALAWLGKQLGRKHENQVLKADTPQEVAMWVHRLREKSANSLHVKLLDALS